MTEYMHYQGRAVEVYGWTPSGQAIPQLYPGDRGANVGDYAVVDDMAMRWDGDSWVPTPWKDLAVLTNAAS